MNTNEDLWLSDDFENQIAGVLISQYENNVTKNKGAPPSDRMSIEKLFLLRNNYLPYVPSNSRIFQSGNVFDIENDLLPEKGCLSMLTSGKVKEANPNSYAFLLYFKKVSSLGKYWLRKSAGQIYEFYNVMAEQNSIQGERFFVTVNNKGEVISCQQKIGSLERSSEELNQIAFWASFSLQAMADKRFSWTMTAIESNAKVEIGCVEEEIKSLLYARTLPVTETGRKRPILHVVASHKRRLKNGTDIDIKEFLRGTRTVEIGNTRFIVNPPKYKWGDLNDAR